MLREKFFAYVINEPYVYEANKKLYKEIEPYHVGWKHGPITPENDSPQTKYIICVKNPYAWLNSMLKFWQFNMDHNYHGPNHYFNRSTVNKPEMHLYPVPHMCRKILAKFLKTGTVPFDDFLRDVHYTWDTPMHRYNEVVTGWLDFCDAHKDKSYVFDADRFVTDEGSRFNMLMSMKNRLKLRPRKLNQLKPPTDRVNPHKEVIKGDTMDYGFYREERYLARYEKEDIEFVNQNLDWKLMKRLGYRKRTFEDVQKAKDSCR